jgi:Flp pilus assembly protein TadD
MAALPSDELREQGNDAFRSGDFLKAAAAYTRALKVDPGNAVLYRRAGAGWGRGGGSSAGMS